jgi:3-hydroxyacyl-CoA dehydrogenase
VEVGVGLIPGGGGTMQLLRNLYGPFASEKDFDPLPFLKKVFLSVGMAKSGFRAPRPTRFRLAGPSGAATIDMMLYDMQLNNQISEHDRKIGQKLARVLTGGDTSPTALLTEEQLLELELEAFLSLAGEEKTQDRLMFMLEKGKPLRN